MIQERNSLTLGFTTTTEVIHFHGLKISMQKGYDYRNLEISLNSHTRKPSQVYTDK